MILTKKFKDIVQERAIKDPVFRRGLLKEAINEFLSGDSGVAKLLLRDYINSGPSFEKLSKKTKISDKSLQRMLGVNGNPTTSNFCTILHAIQKIEGVAIEVKIRH